MSLALEKIEQSTGWTWEYQVPVFGGRDRAGGNVIDFIVHTPGMWTILDPIGSPWHTGAREDRYQMENGTAKELDTDCLVHRPNPDQGKCVSIFEKSAACMGERDMAKQQVIET